MVSDLRTKLARNIIFTTIVVSLLIIEQTVFMTPVTSFYIREQDPFLTDIYLF